MSIRVAIIGLGKMGLLHGSLLNTMVNVELVALCEKSTLIRRFARKIFKDATVVGDVEELADLRLDAVYVTTPVFSHFPITRTVCLNGIARSIFVEKPLAGTGREAVELCNLVNARRSVNMVGYNRRFGVTFQRAKGILDEGTLGTLISFEGYAYSSDFVGVRASAKASSRGSVLRDLGCHVIDLALWFFGDLQVESVDSEPLTGSSTKDSVGCRVKTSNGVVGQLQSSWQMTDYRLPEIGLMVKGSKGIMRVNDDKLELRLDSGSSFIWYRHDIGDNVPFFLGGAEYYREDEHFVRAVMNGTEAVPSFHAASKVDRLIDRIEGKREPK